MRLTWDVREYETGFDQGVFYPTSGSAVPWNGLISVDEKTDDVNDFTMYLDGQKIKNAKRGGSFAATIHAYTYPDVLFDYLVTAQRAKVFGLSYRVFTANGYRTHLVYNAKAHLTDRSYTQTDASNLSFDITTNPVAIPNAKPSAHLIIDTETAQPVSIVDLEAILYGDETNDARLPLPDEIFNLFDADIVLRVIDNGDGTFTVTGPDEAIQMLDPTTFEIDWSSAIYVEPDEYRISSF